MPSNKNDSFYQRGIDPEHLTPRQRKFVNAYVRTGNAKESMREVSPQAKEKSLSCYSGALLRLEKVRNAIIKQYRKNGLTDDYIKSSAMEYVEMGKINSSYSGPGVSALGHLAKIQKLFDDGARNGSLQNVVVVIRSDREIDPVQVLHDLPKIERSA